MLTPILIIKSFTNGTTFVVVERQDFIQGEKRKSNLRQKPLEEYPHSKMVNTHPGLLTILRTG